MSSIKNVICGALAASLVSAAAFAGNFIPTYTQKDRLKTTFSLGIQWDFGDMQPQLVGAVRRTETTSREAVNGGKIDIALPLRMDMFLDPTIRILGLSGGRTVQGELGLGWRVRSSELIAAVGVQAPYTNGGVNFSFSGAMRPYLGVNTIGRAPGPTTVYTFAPPPIFILPPPLLGLTPN
ncbi:MAG: hypothetical protein JWN07_1405 [Hyphomicrobiales bacterium]|nr:hypothetical protein [Hyphomicrobiales bacterium]